MQWVRLHHFFDIFQGRHRRLCLGRVTEMAAAADANRVLWIGIICFIRPVANAPLEQSPAAVVSTGLTAYAANGSATP